MKEINVKFNFHPSRNAEHYQAHHDLLEIITVDFVTAFGIPSLREEYQRLFDIENDCYLRNAAYQDTPELQAADRKRDDLFLYNSQSINTAGLSPVEAIAQAGKRLAYVLDPYKKAPRLSYAANTAAVTDFVDKMRETANAADIATLGLTAAIDALDEANKAFNRIYSQRSTELLTRSASENMKSIRSQVDDAFKATASAINAFYQVNELTTKDAEKGRTLAGVIDSVNAVLFQLQSTLSRAGVGSKPTAKPDDRPVVDSPAEGGGDDDDRPVIE
ncbi:DUF6261 family protein [Parabacteroides sp.]